MTFWRELRDESGKIVKEPPLLTDEMITACEKKFRVKFPVALINLLKTRNGGCPENGDFKLGGKDETIDHIMGIWDTAEYGNIEPLSHLLDPVDMADESKEIRKKIGDPARLLPFTGDGHSFYALDYTRLNRAGEPIVIYMDIEGGAYFRKVAHSL